MRRLPEQLRWLPAGVAGAAAVAAAAVALAGIGADWWSSVQAPSPVEAAVATATLTPRSAAFGDPVLAQLDVVVDTRRVAAASVTVAATFAPWVAHALPVTPRQAGAATLLRYRWRLECLTDTCLATGASRTFAFPAPKVTADDTALTPAWPALEVLRRTTAAEEQRDVPPWRLDTSLPDPTWGARATMLAWLLGAGTALLLLAAGTLLALALRPGARQRTRLAGIERGVALVREALARNDDAARRRALESLASELRQAGAALPGSARDGTARDADELAGAADRLAWSATPPAAAEIAALLAELDGGAA